MFGRAIGRSSVAGRRSSARHRARVLLGAGALLLSTLQPAFVAPASADPTSPLAVTKTANPSPVTSGGQLTYTITMKNTGGAKVDTVVMTDQVNGVGTVQSPPGLPQLTITSTQGPCSQGGANGNVVTCQIGTIAGGATVTVTIRGQVTAASGTTLNNTASVTGTKSAQNFTTNATVQVLVQGTSGGGTAPDLTLNKTGPTSVATGANMDYVLTVNNLGNANTANVKVVDTLPAGVTLQSSPFETTSLFTCGSAGSPITVTCTGGTVNAGQNATIKIHAIAPATAGQITNTAIVDPDQQIAEANELNNSSAAVNTSVTTAPPPAGLTIVKSDGSPDVAGSFDTGAGPDPVNPGQTLTYKILVTNAATTRADDVVITDGTQSLEASSIVASQVVANGTIGNTGGCFVNAPQVTCKVRTLNPGGTITVTIQGLVVSTAGASIFNTATVTGNIKNQGVQASDSESTTVRPAVDLTITKADSPDPVCARSWPTTSNPTADHLSQPGGSPAAAGDIPAIGLLAPAACLHGLTYAFVVGNSGNTQATNVAIRDQLASGVIFDSWDASGGSNFSCSVNASNVVSCTGGTIPAASTAQIRFLVVAPPTVGTLTNSVTVDPNNAIFEPDETNNDATTTTDVRTGIDLVIWKSDKKTVDPPGGAAPLAEGFDPIATSGTGTYTIIVDNVGTQDSTGIKVVDTLPAGTKFLSVQADQGFTCGHNGAATGGVVTCIGGHLVGTESEFYDPAGSAIPTTGHDEFATIKIKFFATPFVQLQAGALMHNEVRVDPDNTIDEVNELNNLAIDDTVVTTGNDDKGAFNQLTIDKTQVSPASNGAVATNGILIYNLHVENLGTDPVSNVEVKDFLPTGTRFISATDVTVLGPTSAKFFCAHDGSPTGGTVACIGGDFSGSLNKIGSGATEVPIARDIRIKVFAPNTPQTAVNTGTVDPANLVPEGNEFDNDDDQNTTVSPCVGQAACTAANAVYELTIDKAQNRSPIARNGLETYTLTVSNLGSDSISGVTVKDFLPAGTRFFDARDTSVASDPSRFSCSYDGSPTGGTVTCVGGVLDGTGDTLGASVPQSRQIQIRAFMPDTPGTYTNRSLVDPSNAIAEGNEFNNESDIDTVVANGGGNPYIDLQVDKTEEAVADQDGTADPIVVDTGQGIRYHLLVKNVGEGDAFNVTVRDVIPAGTTFFSAVDSTPGTNAFTCSFSAPNIDCTGGTLLSGASRDILVTLIAPTGLDKIATDPGDIRQTIRNQAFIDPFNAIGEGDETNNGDLVVTSVQSQVNLTLDKEGPNQANQNQEADYVITVKNEKIWGDGRIAFGAVVVDDLPPGLIPLTVNADKSNMHCAIEENPVNVVTCTGDIEPDQEITITVHVFITAQSGSLDNEACIDPGHLIDETSELDNCKTKTTEVEPPAAPNLNINKNASKGTVTAGETFTYTVTASNVGNATASGTITVTDILPTEVTYQNASATNGFTCTQASGTVTCTGSNLAAGQATVVTIEVKVNDGVTSSFTNTASVSGASQTKSASVTTNVGGAAVDLVLSDITDTPDPANVGQNIDYTFTVTNAGTNSSGAFDISADMDSVTGLNFVGASGSQGFICGDISGTTVTCSGTLPAGQSTNVKITFQVTAGSPSTHELTVKADAGDAVTESSEANNQQTELTTITGSLCTSCIDLVIGGILDTPDPISDGATVTFVVTASNAGDVATTGGNTVVEFNVPIGVDYVSATATAGFTCSFSDFLSLGVLETVDCTGDLLPGQGVLVTVTTTASDSERDTWLGSTVSLLSSGASIDPGDTYPEGTGAGKEFTNANNGPIYESTTFPT
jgi:large repetitive protein